MKSQEYREIIRVITNKVLRNYFPRLDRLNRTRATREIATAIHARMYGANVDGVESPLWRTDEPAIEAKELLNEKNDICNGGFLR
mgnify:CR=1 FL=1